MNSSVVIGKVKGKSPVIGDNVTMGVHAVVIGGITIGKNAEIGAGAIVTHDVPENAVVIGTAAHIHRIKDDE